MGGGVPIFNAMQAHDVFQMIMIANLLTACIIYGFWRIIKDEWDWRGILWLLVPLLIVGLLSFPFQ